MNAAVLPPLIVFYIFFYCCERFITVMQTVVNKACFASAYMRHSCESAAVQFVLTLHSRFKFLVIILDPAVEIFLRSAPEIAGCPAAVKAYHSYVWLIGLAVAITNSFRNYL